MHREYAGNLPPLLGEEKKRYRKRKQTARKPINLHIAAVKQVGQAQVV